jgi:hypothetical protein
MATKGAKPKRVPKSDAKQFERFRETARKLGANESMEDFEVKFKKIVPAKHVSGNHTRSRASTESSKK